MPRSLSAPRSRESASIPARRAAVARLSRDFIVPTGMPSAAAASVSLRPSRWWTTSTARCSGDSRLNARSISSRVSTSHSSERVPNLEIDVRHVRLETPGSPSRRITAADEDLVQPGLERLRVAQCGQLAPQVDQRFLDCLCQPDRRHGERALPLRRGASRRRARALRRHLGRLVSHDRPGPALVFHRICGQLCDGCAIRSLRARLSFHLLGRNTSTVELGSSTPSSRRWSLRCRVASALP